MVRRCSTIHGAGPSCREASSCGYRDISRRGSCSHTRERHPKRRYDTRITHRAGSSDSQLSDLYPTCSVSRQRSLIGPAKERQRVTAVSRPRGEIHKRLIHGALRPHILVDCWGYGLDDQVQNRCAAHSERVTREHVPEDVLNLVQIVLPLRHVWRANVPEYRQRDDQRRVEEEEASTYQQVSSSYIVTRHLHRIPCN